MLNISIMFGVLRRHFVLAPGPEFRYIPKIRRREEPEKRSQAVLNGKDPRHMGKFRVPKGMESVMEEKAWIREMKKKVEENLIQKETETLLYWKGELEKILAKRPESLGTFQIEIQNLVQRMQNRLRILKIEGQHPK